VASIALRGVPGLFKAIQGRGGGLDWASGFCVGSSDSVGLCGTREILYRATRQRITIDHSDARRRIGHGPLGRRGGDHHLRQLLGDDLFREGGDRRREGAGGPSGRRTA